MAAKIRLYPLMFKARIFALLMFGCLGIACSGAETPEIPRDQQFLVAVDSAYRTGWRGFRIESLDSSRPSPFFDTSLRYILMAVELEREKRLAADSIPALDALSPRSLRDNRLRQQVARELDRWIRQFRSWESDLHRIQAGFLQFRARTLDSAELRKVDSATQIDLFLPPGRSALDSTQVALLITQRLLLRLIDSAGRGVRVDSVVRFTEQTFVDQYDRLVARLDSLALKEHEIIARAGATASPSDVVDTLPAKPHAPSQTAWPKAIRVF